MPVASELRRLRKSLELLGDTPVARLQDDRTLGAKRLLGSDDFGFERSRVRGIVDGNIANAPPPCDHFLPKMAHRGKKVSYTKLMLCYVGRFLVYLHLHNYVEIVVEPIERG